MNEARYQAWINFLFNHKQEEGEWRYDQYDPSLLGSPAEMVAFTQRMMEHYDQDMASFSDWQLSMGLSFFFDNGFSDFAFALRDGPVELEQRLAAIRSLKALYEKCFAERCQPVLGHLSEKGSELNAFCYMIWDITPLSYCTNKQEKPAFYQALFEVLKTGLYAKNIACVESALHGLGHIVLHYRFAAEVIEEAIPRIRRNAPRLLAYAEAAKVGAIQ